MENGRGKGGKYIGNSCYYIFERCTLCVRAPIGTKANIQGEDAYDETEAIVERHNLTESSHIHRAASRTAHE